MTTELPPTIMSVRQLAAYLDMAPVTIYRLATRGALPGHKIGGQWRFHKKAIDYFVMTGQLTTADNWAADQALQAAMHGVEE